MLTNKNINYKMVYKIKFFMTGWTVVILILNQELVILDKLSYYSNIIYINSTRCEKILLIGGKSSSYFIQDRKIFTNMEITRLVKFIFVNFSHQRLYVEHLIYNFFSGLKILSKVYVNKIITLKNVSVNKNSISENKELFYQWLVGFTDGDGSFSIIRQNNKWNLTYKIGQSTYNLKVLYFIQKQLKAGSIKIEKNGKIAEFRIRDLQTLNKIIFPIFDKYPLLTSKYFNYIKFREAYTILINKNITKIEKDKLINKINVPIPTNYISPVFTILSQDILTIKNLINYEFSSKVMSKSWLVGFTEAEGSFYLVKKSNSRLVHAFEINQKLDEIVLISIKHLLHINTQVKFKNKGYFSLCTTNSRAIVNIISFYKNSMKSMKSLEFRIWARSYVKYKGNFLALENIRNKTRLMKTKYQSLESLEKKI